MELICVRHGRTAWNALRRFQGQTDVPLDDEGLAQAQALVVERDIGLALEAAQRVPSRAPVPDADQFHAAYFLRNGRPSCATSRSCMSLACSSSIARMPSSIVRVVESLTPK